MVALLRNSQRAINKTKPKKKKAQPIKTKRRNQPKEEERKRKKVGEAIIIIILIIIQKKNPMRYWWAIRISFFWSCPGSDREDTQGWRGVWGGSRDAELEQHAEKETFFPARPLGEDAAVLRSEHPFSDWLLEGAQGSGWRHRAPRCLQWHCVNSSLQTLLGSRWNNG